MHACMLDQRLIMFYTYVRVHTFAALVVEKKIVNEKYSLFWAKNGPKRHKMYLCKYRVREWEQESFFLFLDLLSRPGICLEWKEGKERKNLEKWDNLGIVASTSTISLIGSQTDDPQRERRRRRTKNSGKKSREKVCPENKILKYSDIYK